MKTAVLLMSHTLTPEQQTELMTHWRAPRIVVPPPELLERWSSVPPDGPYPHRWIEPLILWLENETRQGDLVVVQGEPGSVFCVVHWCFAHGRVPLYATTAREVHEEQLPDGSVVTQRVFRHRNFRAYPAPTETPAGAGERRDTLEQEE